MTDLPPPNFGPPTSGWGSGAVPPPPPPPPPASPGAWTPQPAPAGAGGPPPPPGGFGTGGSASPPGGQGRRRGLIIGAIVAVLALGAGGVYLATKDDGGGEATERTEATDEPDTTDVDTTAVDTTEPETTVVETTVVDTTEPETTVADTSEPESSGPPTTFISDSTVVDTTGVETTLPAGEVIDLGGGVALPLPDGWTQTSDGVDPAVISDGTTYFSAQVLNRAPGEPIAAFAQEYADTFNGIYDATGFSPVRFRGTLDGKVATNEYIQYYASYDAGVTDDTTGAIDMIVRADGLSLLTDTYSTSPESQGLPQDAYDALVADMLAAKSVGPTAPLVTAEPFLVKSSTPYTTIEGLAGFSVPPGFNVVNAASPDAPYTLVSNGNEDVLVIKTPGVPDAAAAVAAAQANLALHYTNLAYSGQADLPARPDGLLTGYAQFTGTSQDGRPSAGYFAYYLDPTTANAYVITFSWFTEAGPDSPAPAEQAFMENTFANAFDSIP